MPGNFHAVPEAVLKTWPPPNYVDPKVRRDWMPAFSGTLLAFSTLLIAGRFYLRARRQAGDFGLDDLFIFIGWFVSVGFTAGAVINSTLYGLNVHTWDVPPEDYVNAALVAWIAQVLFLVSTCATKTSVLLFYRRMVKGSFDRRWIWAIYAALAFTAAFFVAILIVYCLICQPLSAYWESYSFTYDKEFKCIDGNALTPLVGVLSIVSDIYAVVLPFFMLRHYQLDVPRRQRIGLNIIFSLGLVVAGCGIGRTYYLWKINHTYDTSWVGYDLYVWSLLECDLAIICACAPSLRVFFRRYLSEHVKSAFKSKSSSNRSAGKGNTNQDASHGESTLRGSMPPGAFADVGKGKMGHIVEQSEFDDWNQKQVEEGRMAPSEHRSSWSGTRATTPTIRNPQDYEAYALKQLKQHRYGRSLTSEKAYQEMQDPTRRHDFDNSRSWLDDSS